MGLFRRSLLPPLTLREPDHELKSEFVEAVVPFGWEETLERTVESELVEAVEEIEEFEFVLARVFRGTKTGLTSSESIGVLASMEPHAGR